MATAPAFQFRGKPTAAARRRLKLRWELFPDIPDDAIWSRATFVGFTTIPRSMSVIMRIIDSLDQKSAGRVYFDLWCRAFEDFFIEIKDEEGAAYSAGYSGQRAVRSWRERIEVLEEFGFVKTRQTPYGAYRYILVLEPHAVIAKLGDKVNEHDRWALRDVLMTVGAITS
jgi:hypothetical protein